MCGWWSMRAGGHEGLRHTSGVQGGGVLLATPKCLPHAPRYRMCIFIPSHVVTQVPLMVLVWQLRKMKKSQGKAVLCGQVFEKSPQHMKNFGIWLCYGCSGTDKMHRESTGSDHRSCLHSATEARVPSTMSVLAPSELKWKRLQWSGVDGWCQAGPRLQNQVSIDPVCIMAPAQATPHYQDAPNLLLHQRLIE